MSNNITISDVAEALGVSKTTVSRAISGKGRIGAATRKRVLEYIQEQERGITITSAATTTRWQA